MADTPRPPPSPQVLQEKLNDVAASVHPRSLADISRLTAEATMGQYETIAKEIEQLGLHAVDQINQIADMISADTAKAAAMVRDNGRQKQAMVEEAGRVMQSVRDSFVDLKRKLSP